MDKKISKQRNKRKLDFLHMKICYKTKINECVLLRQKKKTTKRNKATRETAVDLCVEADNELQHFQSVFQGMTWP